LPAGYPAALEAAKRRYRSVPGVLGVAGGIKLLRGKPTGEWAVLFFVDRKLRRPSRRLPRFVYGRDGRGKLLRPVRIPTDVIATGVSRFACGAGRTIHAAGERGAMTLLFRDRAGGDSRAGKGAFYLLTCAHVAGDLERSPPLSRNLRVDRPPGESPFAVVIKNTVARRGVVEYDAALARVCREALPVPDLAVERGGRITGWLQPGDLAVGMELELCCPSGRRRGKLFSLSGDMVVYLDGRPYRVRNLHGLATGVQSGDSGGLVRLRGRAAGMVVARSPRGYTWWQPLPPALEFLNRLLPRTGVRPF